MDDGVSSRDDARTTPRFVPKQRLSMFVAGSASPLVHGDIKDLSELGACVRTDTALENGRIVTINVKNGYSFLFRAEGRVVWRAQKRQPKEPFDCAHGVRFTDLSPFTRKLIRRLGGHEAAPSKPSATAPLEGIVWDSDSDPDLQILFDAERAPADVDRDRLDALNEPLETSPAAEPVSSASHPAPSGVSDARAEPSEARDDDLDAAGPSPSDPPASSDAPKIALPSEVDALMERATFPDGAELSGNLGHFDSADVLQMLEATRATGVLYVEGPVVGAIHMLEGRVCRCVSEGLKEDEAAHHLVVARSGRFHFVPCPVPENARQVLTTTQLVLEAQLKRDRGSS